MNEAEVPAENLLGSEGDGFRIAMGTLVSGRLSVAAGCLGVIEDCLAEAVNYAKSRAQHGKEIARTSSFRTTSRTSRWTAWQATRSSCALPR